MSNELVNKLEAVGLQFLRRMWKALRTEKKTNLEVLGVTKSLIKAMRKSQTFMQHIHRRGEIQKLAVCGKILDNKSKRRQRKMFVASLNNNVSNINFIKIGDREDWTIMQVNVFYRLNAQRRRRMKYYHFVGCREWYWAAKRRQISSKNM